MSQNYYKKGFSTAMGIGVLVILIILAGGVYYTLKQYSELPGEDKTENTGVSDTNTNMMTRVISISLKAQNASGETGTATLADSGSGTKVTIRLSGAPAGVPQPAHIHVGSCPNPGRVTYPLPNVVNGESTVTLSVSLDDLLGELPLAINVHKSGTEVATYVACGDITGRDTMMNTGDMMDTDTGGMMGQPQTKSFAITAQNFSFSQTEIRVKKGDIVKIRLTSAGSMHDWVLDEFNAKTSRISAGESAQVEFRATKTGTFEYYCSVGSHRQMGMVGKLIVE